MIIYRSRVINTIFFRIIRVEIVREMDLIDI